MDELQKLLENAGLNEAKPAKWYRSPILTHGSKLLDEINREWQYMLIDIFTGQGFAPDYIESFEGRVASVTISSRGEITVRLEDVTAYLKDGEDRLGVLEFGINSIGEVKGYW